MFDLNLRSNQTVIVIIHGFFLRCFYQAIKEWNALDLNIRNSDTFSNFANSLIYYIKYSVS